LTAASRRTMPVRLDPAACRDERKAGRWRGRKHPTGRESPELYRSEVGGEQETCEVAWYGGSPATSASASSKFRTVIFEAERSTNAATAGREDAASWAGGCGPT
jgi:hypothetical protein